MGLIPEKGQRAKVPATDGETGKWRTSPKV